MDNIDSNMLFYFISIFISLFSVVIIGIKFISIRNKKKYYNQIIWRYYPKDKHSYKSIAYFRKIYINMERSYKTYFNYIDIKSNEFMKYIEPKNESSLEPEGYDTYKRSNLRIRGDALEEIKNVLLMRQTLTNAIKYYEDQGLVANKTKVVLEIDSEVFGYEKHFKQIYHQWLMYLKNIESHCEIIISNIYDEVKKCNEEIHRLERIKKPTLTDKILDGGFAIITAPVRHTINIVSGIATGNSEKVIKSGLKLGIGLLGIGAIVEAIDALEALDNINAVADGSLEFVDPHFRTLSEGSEIWIDGDGDTSINLSNSEGGGYWRE
ncbi:hypothetical protein [Terribacillus halophilus]|uniref:hypothetical protein n=1 Tax=Terribacillus halophilus TaxID=361279 RepID=UPI000985B7F1|nr:hypothetical protein [Terribacillus halophilus]